MCRTLAGIVLIVCVAVGVCYAGHSGTFSALDDLKLARQLTEMGMFELLEGLADRMADPSQARYMLARGKLARAAADKGLDHQTREKMLDKAISQLAQLAEVPAKAGDADELLSRYRLLLDLVEAKGILKAGPYAKRIMYLQDGPSDRAVLARIIEDVIPRIAELKRRASDTLLDWGSDLRKLVTILPELELLRDNLRYKSAWVYFYGALVLPEGSAKHRLLQDAIDAAAQFVEADISSGVKHWSVLLVGMCYREMGDDFALADQTLRAAYSKAAPPAVRAQALFEIARNFADHGRFEQALEATERFRSVAPRLLAHVSAAFQSDVQATILAEYLHEQWASGAKDESVAKMHRMAGQKELLGFLNRHRSRLAVRDAFLNVLAARRPKPAKEDTSSVVLLALACRQPASPSEQSLAESERLLKEILAREDEISVALHADAIWQLAMLMNARRDNSEAGRLFAQLARRFPLHDLALKAAKNAVYSFSGVIDARTRANEIVSAELRRDYMDALQVMLSGWGGRDDLANWYFDLGWQYQQLADDGEYALLRKAIDAYDRVPSSSPERMQARYLSLKLQTALLDAPPELRVEPVSLVSMLDQYGVDVHAAVAQLQGEAAAKPLREWGALAEFGAARVLYEKLGRKGESLVRLRNLAARWPHTDALQMAWEFEIAKLVEQERTDEAISKVEMFNQEYPAESEGLIRLVASQLLRRIENMRRDSSNAKRLKAYGEVFRRFSEKLISGAEQRKLPPGEVYPLRQMQAEAMLAVGKPDQALALFKRCAAYDASERAKAARRIDNEIDERIASARSARMETDAVRDMVNEYYASVEACGLASREVGPGDRLAKAVQHLQVSPNLPERAARHKVVVEVLVEGLESLRKVLKRSLPIDAHNTLGMARANVSKGDYGSALGHYSRLVGNMDVSAGSEMYWRAQLERCECMLKAFQEDAKELKRLRVLVRQLELADRAMGGLREEFLQVRLKADRSR